MKRMLLSAAVVVALVLGGLFSGAAQAHGPYGGIGCGPHGNYGGYLGYGGLYGGAYSPYYSPYNVYSNRFVVPYGAGYSGGWQPYQGFRSAPHFGLYLGF